MTTRLAGLALASLLLLASPAYADDPEPKKAEDAGKLISLQFDEAPIAKVIEAIAVAAGKNIIISEKAQGRVTIDLKQVPWRDALDAVANSLALTVTDEGHGIFVVTPARKTKADAKPKAPKALGVRRVALPTESAWVKRSGAKKKKAGSTQAELEHARVRLALARSRKRMAELSAALERAKVDRGDVSLHAAALKAYAEKAKLATAARKAQNLKIYDVRDIDAKDRRLTRAIARAKHNGGFVKLDRKSLVVQGGADVHERMAKALAGIRTGAIVIVDGAAAEFVIVDQEGRKRTVLVPGYVETGRRGKEGAFKLKGRVVDGKGRPLGGVLVSGEARPAPHKTAKIRAAEARIENLLRALKHLKAANAKAEALQVTKQVSVARTELASLKAEVDAQRRQAAAARAELQRYRVRIGKGASGEAGGSGARNSLHALHEEIRALRGDVRALTELVRELLASQKRRR